MAVASESYAPSVLVSTEGLPEKDWLEYRRRGIGGSDAAAILGISPFATARDLYYDKLKIVPFDDSESNWVAKKMGHLLEDLVAEIFHVKTGYRIYQIKKMFYHPVHTICTLMTEAEAEEIIVPIGTCSGQTLKQVAERRPASLKWYVKGYSGDDNILRAGAKLMLDKLQRLANAS